MWNMAVGQGMGEWVGLAALNWASKGGMRTWYPAYVGGSRGKSEVAMGRCRAVGSWGEGRVVEPVGWVRVLDDWSRA